MQPMRAADTDEFQHSAPPSRKEPRLAVASSRSSSDSNKARTVSPLVLRVLSGMQKGAQVRMRQSRLLVGNLQSECDAVLDVGRAEQHACLVRASKDGWTVLSIAGDLWVGETWVAPQQTQEIFSGDVLTLGEVSFCIADTTTIDWDDVELPAHRQVARAASPARPTKPARPVPLLQRWFQRAPDEASALPPSQRPRRARTGPRLLVALLMLSGLAVGGAGVYLVATTTPVASAPTGVPPNMVAKAQAALARLPGASELTVHADPHNPRRVFLDGYLPERQQTAALDAALRPQGIEADHRWTAIDEFKLDLARRLELSNGQQNGLSKLSYASQGRFVVVESSARMERLDTLIRRVLQDVPAVLAIDLRLSDQTRDKLSMEEGADAGSPIVIRYARASDAPGGVAVSGMDQLLPVQKLQRYDVREVRQGNLPSIVLDNGARYFEGSSLPGGAQLVRIQPGRLTVQMGTETRQIDLDTGLPMVEKQPPLRRVVTGARRNPVAP
jgi:hypothetical protein